MMGTNDKLKGSKIFLFTDNLTAESAFHKGSSFSRNLYQLILCLQKLEMSEKCVIHIYHVAGMRMID